jgi:hypothetical protein
VSRSRMRNLASVGRLVGWTRQRDRVEVTPTGPGAELLTHRLRLT